MPHHHDDKMEGKAKQASAPVEASTPMFGSKETFEEEAARPQEIDALEAVDKAPSPPARSQLMDVMPEVTAREAEGEASAKPDPHLALRRRLHRVIKAITSKRYAGNHYSFTYNDVAKTLRMIKEILKTEPVVMTCKTPVVIVGDLHGQYADLLRIFDSFSTDDTPGHYACRYVFLGDYVDRGKQSLEVLMLCFWLKILYPTEFVMLRGDHECRAVNAVYGFHSEIKARFKETHAEALFEQFNDCFAHLPLCCFVAGKILCTHGGISSKMRTREELMKVHKPLRDAREDAVACDLMWADPMIGLRGEKKNHVRGLSVYFGEEQLDETMRRLGVKLVVRGHQMMQNGFNLFNGHKLVTVFSASSYYPDKPNKGAVMYVTKEGRIGFRAFAPLPADHPAIRGGQIFRESHDVMGEADSGHAVFKPDKSMMHKF